MRGSELLTVLPVAAIILVMLAGLFVSLQRGVLWTYRQVQDIIAQRDDYKEASRNRRDARDEDVDAMLQELLEIGRLTVSLLEAIREVVRDAVRDAISDDEDRG